ncbi:MAG: hypothetical protein R2856_13450 [Caldilineaceae bacterium]
MTALAEAFGHVPHYLAVGKDNRRQRADQRRPRRSGQDEEVQTDHQIQPSAVDTTRARQPVVVDGGGTARRAVGKV